MAYGSHDRQTVLIVDDEMINREILKNLLKEDYAVLEAENGRTALEIMRRDYASINAVLLDVIMPEMDGYEFMQEISDARYENIPIIILTGSASLEEEERALKMGAWDFISKPYQPRILQKRLQNAIARSRMGMLDQMRYLAQHDQLTGLYNRTMFFSETKKMLAEYADTQFVMVRTDIDQFSLLNTFWGEKGGDAFLRSVADGLSREAEKIPLCTFGRINADIFCMCLPYDEETLMKALTESRQAIMNFRTDYYIKPTYGIYVITERDLSVEEMYERASMAAKTCKGKYDAFYGYYDKNMRRATFREQEIVNEMEEALATGQFVPYLQPKYDLKTFRPYGAEALVRWIHPKKGVISPGEFIPIFESNGFIGKLDYYMWESVCRILRRWLDEKRNPAPVSVNISRANMYNPKIVEIITDLTDSYQIPPSLLNLELTESAYMDNPDVMKDVVRRLQEKGFLVMMDDFGSGYSSLNTLKEITVNVLKIDMNFLRGDDGTGRSERILSSMIRMAGWLGIPVVVEGVETKEQVDFLKSVGCGYIQGYYFARPMPVQDYEALVGNTDAGVKKEDVSADLEKLCETIWTSDPHIAFLLNHLFQPVAVFEYSGRSTDVTMLRVNDAFNDFFGYGNDIMKEKEGMAADEIGDLFRRVGSTKTSDSRLCRISDQTGAAHTMQVILNYMGEVENQTVLCAIFMEGNSGR